MSESLSKHMGRRVIIERLEGGQIYYQTFDAENWLISVTVSGQTTQFVYDGDGNLVKKIKPDGSRTIYIGNVYEVDKTSGGAVTRTVTYYPAGGAMRIDGNVYYVLKDRLGSAYATTDATGNVVGEMRYYAFGETRLSTGTMFTDRLYTGQRQIAELGVYHYNARFYSPKLGRFLNADTLMSGFANPQGLNRFSYVANNPVRYTDPTGHMMMADTEGGGGGSYTPSAPDDYCATHPWVCGGGGGGGNPDDGGGDPGDGDGDPDEEGGSGCQLWITNFADGGRIPSWDGCGEVDPVEWEMLLENVGEDVHFISFGWYDTPFFNNYGLPYVGLEGTGCFDEKCYDRSEINYIGEGEALAALGFSKNQTYSIVEFWKGVVWGHPPSEETIEMTGIGWDYYNEHYPPPPPVEAPTQLEDPFQPDPFNLP